MFCSSAIEFLQNVAHNSMLSLMKGNIVPLRTVDRDAWRALDRKPSKRDAFSLLICFYWSFLIVLAIYLSIWSCINAPTSCIRTTQRLKCS